MKIKILDKAMPVPSFSTKGSVGMDVRACTFNGNAMEEYVLKAGQQVSIGIGFAIDLSSTGNTSGAFLLPRSGLGTKHGLCLANTIGLIDTDYHGEIIATMKNNSDVNFTIKKYDRVAQLCILTFYKPEALDIVEEFEVSEEFNERGSNGHGSTGTS